jgi:hypothetical protein
MSQGPWKRLYGLPCRRWHDTDDGLNSDYRPKLADCDVFGTRAVVKAAGFTNVTRGRWALESDPRFHHHVLIFDDGSEQWASRANSVQWIGEIKHQEARARSLANLAQNSQPIETRVTELQESGTVRLFHLSGPRPDDSD